ncbi:MAG TPA: hypothetical protein VNP73_05530, partial [Actinomycetota bacterium]|nr:hypothetical protein [Actinomycetota bacterium]
MRRVLSLCFLATLLGANAVQSARAQDCSWKQVDVGALISGAGLVDVRALAPDDVWVIGRRSGESKTLAIHWDGSTWTSTRTPNRHESTVRGVYALDASGPRNVWAVGFTQQLPEGDYPGSIGPPEPLIEHYNGEKWSVVTTGLPPDDHGPVLHDVLVHDKDDVWIVGTRWFDSGRGKALVMHFNGSKWKIVHSGNKPKQERSLHVVTSTQPNTIWAVGNRA